MTDPQDLADRYAALWNEPDASVRRAGIRALWAPGGAHFTKTREATGYDAIEERIIGSYERSVVGGNRRFRAVADALALRNVVTFHWQMVPHGEEEVLATGREVLILDDQGRILTDYQFVLPST